MNLSEATAAPAPVRIGEKEYQAHPLNFLELGALEEKLRASILRDAATAAVGLAPSAAEILMDRALAKAGKVSYFSLDMFDYLTSFPGTCAAISLSLRGAMLEDELKKTFMQRPDQFEAVADTVLRISGLKKKGEGGEMGEVKAGGAAT